MCFSILSEIMDSHFYQSFFEAFSIRKFYLQTNYFEIQ